MLRSQQKTVETTALEFFTQLLRVRLVRKWSKLDTVKGTKPAKLGFDDKRLTRAEEIFVLRLQTFPGRLRFAIAAQSRQLDAITISPRSRGRLRRACRWCGP